MVSGRITRKMEMEFIIIQTVINIKVTGRMIFPMVKEL